MVKLLQQRQVYLVTTPAFLTDHVQYKHTKTSSSIWMNQEMVDVPFKHTYNIFKSLQKIEVDRPPNCWLAEYALIGQDPQASMATWHIKSSKRLEFGWKVIGWKTSKIVSWEISQHF